MTSIKSTFFQIERSGAVVHLIMNRPEKANGMTPDFWADLPRVLDELGQDETLRCAVISGAGKHFSGGMDLSAFNGIMEQMNKEPGRAALALRETIMRLQDTFNAIERARFPVIAAIHGACIGGAIDLITACDLRIASADAFFAIEEIHIGMAADVGTLQRLPRLIAPAVAAELAYTGRRFQADEAEAIGLISEVVNDAPAVGGRGMELAEEIARKSPLAIAGIKRNLTYARDHSVADGLDYIATWNAGMLRPEDLMKAIQAKMAKKETEFADLLKTG
ncbi:MAG: crotonase/enoyl-CoA hydratase family protein [Rhizobiaceae bacterium]